MNNIYYMTNGSLLLTENKELHSPISHIFFEYYEDETKTWRELEQNDGIQCVISQKNIGFGEAQNPNLFSYADGVDTMQFLLDL